MAFEDLAPSLRLAIAVGLITEEEALEADALANGLAESVTAGTMTMDEGNDVAATAGRALARKKLKAEER